MMFKKWWCIKHISGGDWFPIKVITLFGYPLVTRFYKACGPFNTEEYSVVACKYLNMEQK